MNLEQMNDQKKVVIITFCDQGGMLHYAQCLSGALNERCDTVMVTCGSAKTGADLCIAPKYAGVRRKLYEFYNPLYYIKLAREIVRKFDPDTVHLTSSSMGGLPFVYELKKHGVSVVFTLHDPDPHEENRSLWSRVVVKIHYRLEVLMMKHCSVLHVHSELHKRVLTPRIGKSGPSVSVIQHGAGLSPDVAAGVSIPVEFEGVSFNVSSSLVLLFFGRIEPYKGLGLLMSALIKRDYSSEVTLIIAGQGVIEQDVLRQLQASSVNVITLNRFIPDEEVGFLFKTADVVVLPYLTATQTGVIPLAYAFNKPVIASRVGALPELVEDGKTGILFKAGSCDQLGGCIERYAECHDLSIELGTQASKMMVQTLSWSVVAKRHFDNY